MTNLSTYLQAVEDCKQIIAKSRTVEEKYGIGKTEMMAREQAIVDLQSLKQTKDVWLTNS